MDKGIIKMVIKVMIIAIMLLAGSLYLAMHYGRLMIQSSVSTSDQTDQDNGTGTSNSSSPINQKSMSQQK
jgi:sensor domain CHASE-containing protein